MDSIERYLHSLMPSEKRYLERVQNRAALWVPQSKPQWQALLSRADETFYGGAAGGGKTHLLIGLAVECHQHSVLFRRVYPNLREIIRQTREVIGGRGQENKADRIWTFEDGRTIEFGAVQHEDNRTDWQGRPHDLKAFDELPEFTESQYTFICGWNRTTDPGQRVRVMCTGNPPTDEAGGWVLRRWGAWFDKHHPNPAKPGELRWYATIDGEEREFTAGAPIAHKGETIYPRSRTFIPARLDDNPYYAHDNRYKSVLQALPEPLRSQLLNGDFEAAAQIDPWQVIPTDWVRAAQRRWLERERPATPLTAVGIDPARGGRDNTAMARRYDNWFDEIVAWPGVATSDGPTAANLVRQALGDEEPGYVNIDVVGYGASAYDSLKTMYARVRAVNAAEGSQHRDRSGKLKMRNMRAEYYWRMREALDPEHGDDVALPPGSEIIADLCAAHYRLTTAGVQIEEKDEIKKRLGRSPDKGEALLLANLNTGRRPAFGAV
ncbi:MAG: hypothetical protein WC977_10445 [Anaerovoracaceae bacterium]